MHEIIRKLALLGAGVLVSFLCVIPLQAQQKPVYSQYMVDGYLLNPGYAGYQKVFSASIFDRHQWLNLDGAPNTQTLSVHSGFSQRDIGVGTVIVRDQIGIHTDLSLQAGPAFRVKFPFGNLSMGLTVGFDYLSSDFNKLNVSSANDPLLALGTVNNLKFNSGAGIYFNNDNLFLGLSVPRLIEQNLDGFDNPETNFAERNLQSRYYYLMGGVVLTLGPFIEMVPTGLLRMQENQAIQFDANVNFVFDEVFTAGASYRSGEAIFFLAQVNLSENWRIGYGYDYLLNGLGQVTSGTHEFMLNYRVNLGPRYCHTYF